jgi:hypothetical protein
MIYRTRTAWLGNANIAAMARIIAAIGVQKTANDMFALSVIDCQHECV